MISARTSRRFDIYFDLREYRIHLFLGGPGDVELDAMNEQTDSLIGGQLTRKVFLPFSYRLLFRYLLTRRKPSFVALQTRGYFHPRPYSRRRVFRQSE